MRSKLKENKFFSSHEFYMSIALILLAVFFGIRTGDFSLPEATFSTW